MNLLAACTSPVLAAEWSSVVFTFEGGREGGDGGEGEREREGGGRERVGEGEGEGEK